MRRRSSEMYVAILNPKVLSVFSQLILNNVDVGSMDDILGQFLLYTTTKQLENEMSDDDVELLIKALFKTVLENADEENASLAGLCLINISAFDTGLIKVMGYINSDDSPDNQGVVSKLLLKVNQNAPKVANAVLKLFCNLSRAKNNAIKVYKGFTDPIASFKLFIDLFNVRDTGFEHNYDYISYLISNLCQLYEARIIIMEKGILENLLPFLSHGCALRRSGVIKTVKNCSFELVKHEWLLSEDLDLLPRLLLPLAGPDCFDNEDNDTLPIDLQYLPDNKVREADSTLRIELLEALTQLSAKRSSRQVLRDQGTYLILRELHKWEQDIQAKLACENLVDILIKTEDEIGVDNLHDVDVPEELVDKFEQMDKDYLN